MNRPLLFRPGDWLGPLFERELHRLAQRKSIFLLRLFIVLGLLGLLMYGYPGSGDATIKVQAETSCGLYFATLACQLIVVWLVMPMFAAAVITEERENKTLELILVTPLTSRDLVMGKLMARMVMVGSALLAGLPVFMIMLFLGGLTLETVLLGYLGIAVNLWSVGGMSVAIASLSSSYRWALFGSWMVLLLLVGVVLPLNPVYAVKALADGSATTRQIQLYMVAHGLMGLFGVLVALAGVRPSEAQVPSLPPTPVVDLRTPAYVPILQEVRVPSADRPNSIRVDFGWEFPKNDDEGPSPTKVSLLSFLAAIGLGMLVAFTQRDSVDDDRAWPLTMLLGWLPMCIAIAVSASTVVCREREADTLLMLLTVPAARGEILWRKWVSAWSRWWPLALVTVFIALIPILMAGYEFQNQYWLVGFLIFGLVLSCAAASLGVLLSVRSRTTFQAQLAAVVLTVFMGLLPIWALTMFEQQARMLIPVHFLLLLVIAVGGWNLALTNFEQNPTG